MLTHFTYQTFLAPETRRREFLVSFFHKGNAYKVIYHYNGEIDWQAQEPAEEDKETLTSSIHELMLFHEYDN
jgi:hypothetical protein